MKIKYFIRNKIQNKQTIPKTPYTPYLPHIKQTINKP